MTTPIERSVRAGPMGHDSSLFGAQSAEPAASLVQTKNGKQHIGFLIHNDEFLMPMEPVAEILMPPTITFVPHSDPMVEGIVALRGEIMPVLNLRRILGFPRGKTETTTRVIIVRGEQGGFGILVDDITEFVWLGDDEVQVVEQNIFGASAPFAGVAGTGERMRAIIDVPRLMKSLAASAGD